MKNAAVWRTAAMGTLVEKTASASVILSRPNARQKNKESLDDAFALAASGIPVFPCKNTPENKKTDKTPHTRHGFKDAVTDAAQIRQWWRWWPDALIGVPTGPVSGLFALDVDSVKHQSAADWLERHAPHLPETRQHQTRSGGYHLLFKHHDGLRNTTSQIAHGIDTRGEGGYFIWWPAEGCEVLFADHLAELPAWIIEALSPPKPAHGSLLPTASSCGRGYAHSDDRIRGIIGRVITVREGERNSILFWATCAIRDMIINGDLGSRDAPQALAALAEASRHTGLTEREIMRTITSATAGSR